MSAIREIALAKAIGGSGGGSSVTVEELTVNQNGTTTAPAGTAYNPVITNVQPPLQQKSVNANGDITPDTGYYGLSKVRVDVPQGGGGGDVATIYAMNFTANNDANTAKSGGWQFNTGNYSPKIKGIRFSARDSVCSVYISDTNGNTIASKTGAAVTPGQLNDVLFDAPVTLNKNTSYVVWGSNQSSTMRYKKERLTPMVVTIESIKYSTSDDTFPTSTEVGTATYGVDLIISVTI